MGPGDVDVDACHETYGIDTPLPIVPVNLTEGASRRDRKGDIVAEAARKSARNGRRIIPVTVAVSAVLRASLSCRGM